MCVRKKLNKSWVVGVQVIDKNKIGSIKNTDEITSLVLKAEEYIKKICGI